MKAASIVLIKLYQHSLGPFFGLFSSCRYQPTCSEYGKQAIERFGFARGWWLALRRIGRCRPGGGSGHDPVPDTYVSWREMRRRRHQRGAVRGA